MTATSHERPLGEAPAFARACLDSLGVDHVLFGSDWPHFDADAPSAVLDLPLSDEAKQKVLGANAMAVYAPGR